MLAEATRVLGLIAGALDPSYLRRSARLSRAVVIGYLVAGTMALAAFLFLLVALFAALTAVMPPWAAAVVIAAAAVLGAAIAVLVARSAGRRLTLPPARPPGVLALDPTAAAAATLAPLVDEVLSTTRRRPGETILLAIAAGLILGRLLQRPKE